MLVNQGVFVQ